MHFQRTIGRKGDEAGRFLEPWGVTFLRGLLVVSERRGKRVQVLRSYSKALLLGVPFPRIHTVGDFFLLDGAPLPPLVPPRGSSGSPKMQSAEASSGATGKSMTLVKTKLSATAAVTSEARAARPPERPSAHEKQAEEFAERGRCNHVGSRVCPRRVRTAALGTHGRDSGQRFSPSAVDALVAHTKGSATRQPPALTRRGQFS